MYCQDSFSTVPPKRLFKVSLNGMATDPRLRLSTKQKSKTKNKIRKGNRYVFDLCTTVRV
jgi:hypothetical protein